MDASTIPLIGAFIIILVLLTSLRARSSKFEIKGTDVVVSLLPIVIFMLLTGKIQKLTIGDLSIETAIKGAYATNVASQVELLGDVIPVRTQERGNITEIPKLIEDQTENIKFILGKTYPPANIKRYFNELLGYPYLKYVLIEDTQKEFVALADARLLGVLFTHASPKISPAMLSDWLRAEDRTALQQLPGYISRAHAVTGETQKSEVLEIMEAHQLDWLPVIDDSGQMKGIVHRSELNTSLLVSLLKSLREK